MTRVHTCYAILSSKNISFRPYWIVEVFIGILPTLRTIHASNMDHAVVDDELTSKANKPHKKHHNGEGNRNIPQKTFRRSHYP